MADLSRIKKKKPAKRKVGKNPAHAAPHGEEEKPKKVRVPYSVRVALSTAKVRVNQIEHFAKEMILARIASGDKITEVEKKTAVQKIMGSAESILDQISYHKKHEIECIKTELLNEYRSAKLDELDKKSKEASKTEYAFDAQDCFDDEDEDEDEDGEDDGCY